MCILFHGLTNRWVGEGLGILGLICCYVYCSKCRFGVRLNLMGRHIIGIAIVKHFLWGVFFCGHRLRGCLHLVLVCMCVCVIINQVYIA